MITRRIACPAPRSSTTRAESTIRTTIHSLTIDPEGRIWVYVAGRARSRPGFVYRSVKPHDIDRFELISSDEICYPQPWYIEGEGIVELFTKYTGVRELYWNFRKPDGSRGEDQKLAGMEGQYQTSFCRGRRIVTAFNRHPKGHPDGRTDLYYLETRDLGKTWQTIDGKTIAPPLANPDNPARIKPYSEEGRLVYVKDVTLDGDGNPVILAVTSSDHRPGPQGDPRTWEVLHHKGGAWRIHKVTDSTHNYDTGPIWVEGNGTWRIIGPTERGPQRWGGGGEVAVWTSRDEGRPGRRCVTQQGQPAKPLVSPQVIGADGIRRSPSLGGRARRQASVSRLYFADFEGKTVRRLPYDMKRRLCHPRIPPGAVNRRQWGFSPADHHRRTTMSDHSIDRRRFLQASAVLPLAGAAVYAAETTAPAPGGNAAEPGSWQSNPVIQEARQVALEILKPSQKDLQHGLELHAQSLVFESYGFAPRSAVDGDAIQAAIEAGASDVEIQDMQERMSMTRAATDPAELAEFKQAWEAAGVTCIFQNAGEEGQAVMRLLKRLAHFTRLTDLLPDFLPKAATPDEIVAAKRAAATASTSAATARS